MAHHALKEQERTKLDEEQKELFMQEQEQMKKEWLAQHENAMVSGGSVWWCAVDELYFNTFTFFPVRFSLLPPFFFSLHPPPARTSSAPNRPTPRPNPLNGKNGPNARKKA
jgi:hypothetical protein